MLKVSLLRKVSLDFLPYIVQTVPEKIYGLILVLAVYERAGPIVDPMYHNSGMPLHFWLVSLHDLATNHVFFHR